MIITKSYDDLHSDSRDFVPQEEERVDVDGSQLGHWSVSGDGLLSTATVTKDGRINIQLDLRARFPDLPPVQIASDHDLTNVHYTASQFPRMNIVIMIVGSRGDVQPYVALGKRLMLDRHRVRLATHETFRTFVTEHGLEFFDIGGNPQDLMSYMVKNPGLVPGIDSLTNGDIKRKRKMLTEMITGCWNACHTPCPRTGRHFVADAIISNPPAFSHIHCAEALSIPLLMSFTMPWSATSAFPHPLVNINRSNAEKGVTNYLTYHLAELLTWQGLGDIINKFRMETLGLPPLSIKSGPGLLDTNQIPWTYCMSPALVPKPSDWLQHIDVTGFFFLDLASDYTPAPLLEEFLGSGLPPIYIGFGSVVVDDPISITNTIFEATRQAGVRALVSAGWAGLGGVEIPQHIHIIGNVPHDWLFAQGRVSAVIHHGGAGTTSASLSKGLPTAVVPFFGDQGFWGHMIERAGAGPKAIPPKKLTVERLKDAIEFLMSPSTREAAMKMAKKIQNDDGVNRGVSSFYRHMPLESMMCDLDPTRTAVWWSEKHEIRLSAFAAVALADSGLLNMPELTMYVTKVHETRTEYSDPVTGAGGALFWALTNYSSAVAELLYSPVSGVARTMTALPEGFIKVVDGVYEGLQNVPGLYGSDVRKARKVTNVKSGLVEGGKALIYGVYDGVTGLVKEPVQGAKDNGAMGAIVGSARSWVNLFVKPTAGGLGLFSHPMKGAWASLRLTSACKIAASIHQTRIEQGLDELKRSNPQERWAIVKAFNTCIATRLMQQKAKKERLKMGKAEQAARKESAKRMKKILAASAPVVDSDNTPFLLYRPTSPSTESAKGTSRLDEKRFFRKLRTKTLESEPSSSSLSPPAGPSTHPPHLGEDLRRNSHVDQTDDTAQRHSGGPAFRRSSDPSPEPSDTIAASRNSIDGELLLSLAQTRMSTQSRASNGTVLPPYSPVMTESQDEFARRLNLARSRGSIGNV